MKLSSGRALREIHMRHTYDLVECFCGQGAVSRAFEEKGLSAFKFDIRQDATHNIHEKSGLMKVCEALAQTRAMTSVAMIEPVCGSWIFISLGVSLRHIAPYIN